jgi:hypothetical protein
MVYVPEITTCHYKGLIWFLLTSGPVCSAKVSSYIEPLLHLVDHIMFYVFPHTTEQDSQLTSILISKQAIAYQTLGGTCCPRVPTPKISILADLSMTNHISRWNPTISTIPNLAQTTTSNLTTVNSHHGGWKTKTLNTNTSQIQHHQDGRLVRLSRLHD